MEEDQIETKFPEFKEALSDSDVAIEEKAEILSKIRQRFIEPYAPSKEFVDADLLPTLTKLAHSGKLSDDSVRDILWTLTNVVHKDEEIVGYLLKNKIITFLLGYIKKDTKEEILAQVSSSYHV